MLLLYNYKTVEFYQLIGGEDNIEPSKSIYK